MANRTPLKFDLGKVSQFKGSDTISPIWGGTGLASYTVGDILFASGTTTLAALSDVAIGNVLLSGGISTAPAWGKVSLTVHVTGVLPPVNGGTGLASYTTGNYLNAASSSTLQQRTPSQVLSDIAAAPLSHNHDASDTTTGVFAAARLGSGTTNLSTFLRGDSSWAALPPVLLGNTVITLGNVTSTITGLSSVTSNAFIGTLTGNSTSATSIAITNDIANSSPVYPLWVTTASGIQAATTSSSKLSFVPSTGVLTATQFAGSAVLSSLTVTGVANVTNTTTSSDYSSGALVVNGGVGIGGDLNIFGNFTARGIIRLGYNIGDITQFGVLGGLTTFGASTASFAVNQVIASVDGSIYRSGEFRIQAYDAIDGRYHTSTILAIHNGTTADFVEFGDIDVGGRCGTFDVDFSSGHLRLLVTPETANIVTYKIVAMLTQL